jgi:uncharacterized protein with HEPN domain
MSNPNRDNGYLVDIQTAIARVNRYTQGMSIEEFVTNDLVQDAVLRNIGIIGEAVAKLSKELTVKHPGVPWGDISGMRNRLVHEYNGVNLKLVWNTIQKSIPVLLAEVIRIQQEENSRESLR